jgi:Kef-type K+ transport system membrane component KefB
MTGNRQTLSALYNLPATVIRRGCNLCACLQDIAVVPFLVLLPLVENADLVGQPGQSTMTLVASLGPTALQTLLGLGVLLLGGRVVLRRIFELVRASSHAPASLFSPIQELQWGPFAHSSWQACLC